MMMVMMRRRKKEDNNNNDNNNSISFVIIIIVSSTAAAAAATTTTITTTTTTTTTTTDRLVGLVLKASASREEDPGFESRLRREFSGVESDQWLKKIGTPVATLPSAWRYRVSTGTGWPGVSIL